jgi:hypothetical protein
MKNYLRRTRFALGSILLALPLWALAGQSGAAPTGFTGEVTDTICASAGSHTSMMAKTPAMGHDNATCTKKCAELGAKYVLMDDDSKRVYPLDDQTKAAQFAGQKVKITGTLVDGAIKVTNMNGIG